MGGPFCLSVLITGGGAGAAPGAIGGAFAGLVSSIFATDAWDAAKKGFRAGAVAGVGAGVGTYFAVSGTIAEVGVAVAVGAGSEALVQTGEYALGLRNSFDVMAIATSGAASGLGVVAGKCLKSIACKLGIFDGCFAPETPISTQDGFKAIQAIAVGDLVYAYNLAAAVWQTRRVVETFEIEYCGDLVVIEVAGEQLHSTKAHPFWVVEGEGLADRPMPEHLSDAVEGASVPGRWVDAAFLRVGDTLLLKPNRFERVAALTLQPYAGNVYNFLVDDLHCYAVGASQVLAHNAYSTAGSTGLPVPKVSNSSLANRVRDLFKGAKGPNPIGTGSTADAVRNELLTGKPTHGYFHSQKAEQYINSLTNWLRDNPTAVHQDKLIAQSLLDDLKGAVGGS